MFMLKLVHGVDNIFHCEPVWTGMVQWYMLMWMRYSCACSLYMSSCIHTVYTVCCIYYSYVFCTVVEYKNILCWVADTYILLLTGQTVDTFISEPLKWWSCYDWWMVWMCSTGVCVDVCMVQWCCSLINFFYYYSSNIKRCCDQSSECCMTYKWQSNFTMMTEWVSVIQLSYDSLSICVYMHSYVVMHGDICIVYTCDSNLSLACE